MPDSESVTLLREISASLKELVAISKARRAAPSAAKQGASVATDRELDDPKFGDPEVKFMPRDWTGPSFKGRRFSDCPPDLLDMLADTFDYFAGKNETSGELASNGKPKAMYDRINASKAHGWAARIRSGWKPAEPFAGQEEVKW